MKYVLPPLGQRAESNALAQRNARRAYDKDRAQGKACSTRWREQGGFEGALANYQPMAARGSFPYAHRTCAEWR